MDLSVIIPGRHEMFFRRTVEDVLAHARGATEVIAVVDGALCSSHAWANPDLPDDPRLRVERLSTVIGQRAAVNLGARLARGRYVMKLDAHCSVAEGFDLEMVTAGDALGPDVTQIPRMFNLHVFDWLCTACGTQTYQGPTPTLCAECAKRAHVACGPFERKIIWKPRESRKTDFARFDHELHFQYHRKKRHSADDIDDVMTSVGACFVMRRERFEALGGLDESHGSWGQFGVEISCKSWLSGGRQVVNKRTWFAHCFRTQGGDFGFPYRMASADQDKARAYSRRLWMDNTWPGQVRPLSWLIEKFAPLEDWHEPAGKQALAHVTQQGREFEAHRAPAVTTNPTKGIIYYSDSRGDRAMLLAVRAQIDRARGQVPVVAVTLPNDPGPWTGVQHLTLNAGRGYLTMFRQILAALEASTADVVFHCEHDVLYHPSHFAFTPARDDTFYYNQHTYKVSAEDGRALHYLCSQVSGLCAYRSLLIDHYRKRLALVEQHGFSRELGFEPGTNKAQRVFETRGSETWMSPFPNIDIRHGRNLTKTRWSQAEFRNKSTCLGWTEADEVPGWGRTRGRFAEWLAGVSAVEAVA